MSNLSYDVLQEAIDYTSSNLEEFTNLDHTENGMEITPTKKLEEYKELFDTAPFKSYFISLGIGANDFLGFVCISREMTELGDGDDVRFNFDKLTDLLVSLYE